MNWEEAYQDLTDRYWDLFLAYERLWIMVTQRVFETGR